MAADNKLQVELSAELSGLLNGLKHANGAIGEFAEQVKAKMGGGAEAAGGLSTAIEGIGGASGVAGQAITAFATGPLGLLTAALGAVASAAAVFHGFAERADEMGKAAQKVGLTVEQLSRLRHAAEIADVSAEVLDKGLGQLAKNMQEVLWTGTGNAAKALAELGISAKDSEGQMRPLHDVLLDLSGKFAGMEDSGKKTALAMALFGKSGKEMIPLLNEGRAGIKELEAEADRLGVTLSEKDAEGAAKFNDNMKRVDSASEGLKNQLGRGLLPIADRFGEWAKENAPEALNVLGTAIKALAGWWQFLAMIVQDVGAIIGGIIGQMQANLTGLTTVLWKVFTGDFQGAKDALGKWLQDTKANFSATGEEIQRHWEDMAKGVKSSFSGGEGGGDAKKRSGTDLGDGETEEERRKREERERQAAAKAAAEAERQRQQAFRDEDEYQRERTRVQKEWEDARAELSSDGFAKQELAINRHYDKLLEVSQEHGVNQEEIDQIQAARQEALEQAKTEFLQKQADERERIRQEEADRARELLEQTGTAEQGFMDGLKQSLVQMGTTFQQWASTAMSIVKGVEGAIAHGLTGMLTGQMSFAQGMKAIWKGIVEAVAGAIAKMIAQWIVAALVQRAVAKQQNEAEGSKTAAALTAATAETWEAYAGIPFVGPFLAAAQTALMFTSFGASMGLATAAGAKVTAMAKGGLVDSPLLGLIGEAGPEVIAPQRDFIDYSNTLSNLTANIAATRALEVAYDRRNTAAAGMGGFEPGGGGVVVHVHGHVLDTSRRGMQAFGEAVQEALKHSTRSRSVVITPGQAFGAGI